MILAGIAGNLFDLRINGQTLKVGNIDANLSESEIETNIKASADGFSVAKGYHCYFHVADKINNSVQIWLGKLGIEPRNNWWLPRPELAPEDM